MFLAVISGIFPYRHLLSLFGIHVFCTNKDLHYYYYYYYKESTRRFQLEARATRTLTGARVNHASY